MAIKCEWCRNPNADDAANPFDLCDSHAAEYEGISVSELYRRDREQYAEWLDTLG